jgi:aminoglycoside phosphotransferase (APT) family kinase protein
MLSPVEQQLIQRDRELPGLGLLLAAEEFRQAVQAQTDVRIGAARLRYLRYKPGQNCLAGYALEIGGRTIECHAKAHRFDALNKLDKAAERTAVSGALGRGRLVLAKPGVEVCVFPNDNKLETLAALDDASWRADFLQRHLPLHTELWSATLATLAYKPERRWVGVLHTKQRPVAVCKLYTAAAYEVARQQAKGFESREVLQTVPVLGRSKGRHALFLGWQTGDNLAEAWLRPDFAVNSLRRVGWALRDVHQQPSPRLPRRAPAKVAEAVLKLGEFIGHLLPMRAQGALRLAERIAAAVAAQPEGNDAVHGDFYAKQILLSGERVTVLDFDEAQCGDGLVDLGAFLAHLEREVLAGRLSVAQRDCYESELLAGYRDAGGLVDEGELRWHTAERVLARAADFFRTHEARWPELTEALLERVAELVEGGGANRSVVRLAVTEEKRLPGLDAAMDAREIEPRLREILQRRDPSLRDVTVARIALQRHKPGRRALIHYGLELRRTAEPEALGVLGKIQRRGVDEENQALLAELTAETFAATAGDGLSIPAPLGAIPELNLTLQPVVSGRLLAEWLLTSDGPRAAERAAAALVKLHQAEIAPCRTHTIADELDILAARFTRLAATRPRWDERLRELLESCRELGRQVLIVSPRPIHRDFYHDQLLWDRTRLWLLDLDLLCLGDPALDAGNFLGHLVEWGIRQPMARPALQRAEAVFREAFLAGSPRVDARAVEIYTTLTLARHVSLSTQFAERAPFAEQILTLTESRCQAALGVENYSPTL